jgi:DNA invertase Pin-like site-specific DNA recombinase
MPMLDTTQYKDLIGNFVSNLVLEVLSFVAEQERQNIKQRQAEGIAIAKAQGKHLGRPKTEYPKEFKEVYEQWKNGATTGVKAMEQLGIKKTTFYKLVKEYEEGK